MSLAITLGAGAMRFEKRRFTGVGYKADKRDMTDERHLARAHGAGRGF